MSPNVPAERISTGFARCGVSDSEANVHPDGSPAVKPCVEGVAVVPQPNDHGCETKQQAARHTSDTTEDP
jgi:hypothetical protein